MLLGTVLTVITWSVWIVFFAWVILSLWQTARQQGFGVAVRRLFTRIPVALLLVAIGISFLYLAVLFIEPQEVAVVVSLISPEGYRDRPLRSGLRWIVPLAEEAKRYPISWQTYTMASKPTEGQKVGDDSILARTSDGQEVSIDCSVIFQIDPEEVIRLHIEWQGRYIEDFVRPVVRGLVRTEVSQYTVDEVNSSKRLDLERDLDDQVREVFGEKGLILDRFILRNIAFSPEYAAAVEQKQVALQQKIQADYQASRVRQLAQGEADATRTKAQAQADAFMLIEQALAKDKNLLTYQYIEKLSPSIRTMLLPSNGSYILPVPPFDQQESDTSAVMPRATPAVTETLSATGIPVSVQGTPTPTPKP